MYDDASRVVPMRSISIRLGRNCPRPQGGYCNRNINTILHISDIYRNFAVIKRMSRGYV